MTHGSHGLYSEIRQHALLNEEEAFNREEFSYDFQYAILRAEEIRS